VTLTPNTQPKPSRPVVPVRVRIVDEEGSPVPGLRVSVGYVANGVSADAETDAGGAATVSAEFAPSTIRISPKDRSDGWSAEVRWLRPGEQEATIVVRRTRAITGVVLSPAGKPVENAWVEAFVGPRQVTGALADKEGRYTVRVAGDAEVDLQASVPTDSTRPAPRRAAEQIGVKPGTDGVTLRMADTGDTRTVEVAVVSASGAPVAGAWVSTHFVGENWTKPVGGRTGADGIARVEGLPRSSVTFGIILRDANRGPAFSWSLVSQRVGADVSSVRFVARDPRIVRGRVLAEDGASAKDGFVYAIAAGFESSMTPVDADGRFELLVPSDVPLPLPVFANPAQLDPKHPRSGYALVESEDREVSIVLRDVPAR
jgi:hypothetical protein